MDGKGNVLSPVWTSAGSHELLPPAFGLLAVADLSGATYSRRFRTRFYPHYSGARLVDWQS